MSDDDGVNLDCMFAEELYTFWRECNCSPRIKAKAVFPERPEGYVRATKNLGYYAINKSVAMKQREKGDIIGAQIYEAICDRIYERLPQFARW